MDLATDILNIVGKVSQVPLLDAVCELAIEIIKTVQISKNNTARLQQLSHFVAEQLVKLVDFMKGRWDNTPDNLRALIDEYEVILAQILGVAKKSLKTPILIAFVNASNRDAEITRLKERLVDFERSFLLLVGVETSISVHQIHKNTISQRLIELDIHSDLQQVSRETNLLTRQLVHVRSDVTATQSLDDNAFPIYARTDIRLIRRIADVDYEFDRIGWTPQPSIKLYLAERYTDGRMVWVKTYEHRQHDRFREFSKEVGQYKHLWDPLFLQCIGTSQHTDIPFQLFHAPGDHSESFLDWYCRTSRTNPVETIFGLYDMRISLQRLAEVHDQYPFEGWLSVLLYSVVILEHRSGRFFWTLVYAGQLQQSGIRYRIGGIEDFYGEVECPFTYPRLINPLADAFCNNGAVWGNETRDLEFLTGADRSNLNVTALASKLFDFNWLGQSSSGYIDYETHLRLGDIGYFTQSSDTFTVVGNLHSRLKSEGSSCELPTIVEKDNLEWNDVDQLQIVDHGGRRYQRYQRELIQGYAQKSSSLSYANLDLKHAWGVLRSSAAEIVQSCEPSVDPHRLILVTVIARTWNFVIRPTDRPPDSSVNEADEVDTLPNPEGDVPDTVYLFEHGSPFNAQESDTLSTSLADPVHVRASFHIEPEWLKTKMAWEDRAQFHREFDTKGAKYIEYQTWCYVDYIQLPPGVATPLCKDTAPSDNANT